MRIRVTTLTSSKHGSLQASSIIVAEQALGLLVSPQKSHPGLLGMVEVKVRLDFVPSIPHMA